MRESRVLVMVGVVLMGVAGLALGGQVINFSEADFAYEGAVLPVDDGWGVGNNYGAGERVTSIVPPDIYREEMIDAAMDSTHDGAWTNKEWMSTGSNLFTIDIRTRIIHTSFGDSTQSNFWPTLFDVFDRLDGGTTTHRFGFFLGSHGDAADPSVVDQIGIGYSTNAPAADVTVPGLDITQFNVYRLVNTGSNLKIYVNDIPTPVYDEAWTGTRDDGRAGLFAFGSQPRGSGLFSQTWDIDFIRALTSEARDEMPIPEPATIGLLALGGLALLRRRA